MVRFEALRKVLSEVRAVAPSFVDDERAVRLERTFGMVDGSLAHLEAAVTSSRLANRCPAARRVFDRLASELACEGAKGWEAKTAPALAALTRLAGVLDEAVRIDREARERIASVVRSAA